MTMLEKWASYAKSQAGAARLENLYGKGACATQAARYARLIERHEARFGKADGEICFFSPRRDARRSAATIRTTT